MPVGTSNSTEFKLQEYFFTFVTQIFCERRLQGNMSLAEQKFVNKRYSLLSAVLGFINLCQIFCFCCICIYFKIKASFLVKYPNKILFFYFAPHCSKISL